VRREKPIPVTANQRVNNRLKLYKLIRLVKNLRPKAAAINRAALNNTVKGFGNWPNRPAPLDEQPMNTVIGIVDRDLKPPQHPCCRTLAHGD
jgi:hypothetical protein